MRPPGYVRQALLSVLEAGARGSYDVLASLAGVPECKARQTLWHLRREGVVDAERQTACRHPQRAKAEYFRATSPGPSPALELAGAMMHWHSGPCGQR